MGAKRNKGRRLRRLQDGECDNGEFETDYAGFFYDISGNSHPLTTAEFGQIIDSTCDGGCDVCPDSGSGTDSGVCISDCKSNQFINADGVCEDCDEGCDSCVAKGSCNLCAVADCPRCSTFDRCDVCFLECDPPQVADCDLRLCVCENDDEFWMREIGQCVATCPTSYVKDLETRRCK